MPGRLRLFLYRDDTLVAQFLEQLQGGAFDREHVRQQASGGSSLGVGIVGGPARATASRDRSTSSESELSVRQTGPSRFTTLHDLAVDEIQQFDACDDDIWDQLEEGEILETRVALSTPDIVRTLGAVGRVSSVMPIFNALSEVEDDDGSPLFDPKDVATVNNRLPTIEKAAEAMEAAGIPVVASLVSDDRYKLLLRLKRQHLQVENLQDITGHARLIGTIESKITRGKPLQMPILPGFQTPANRAQRRQGVNDRNAISVRYPAAVITPIAIFR